MTPRTDQILVVEDDDMIRDSMLEILAHHGYHAIGASHGQEALEKLHDGTTAPALILLDLMMPVMDGLTFRQEQLRDPHLASIPVVVISAFKDLRKHAGELNAVAMLKKPMKLRDLLALVTQYCTPTTVTTAAPPSPP